MHSADDLVMCLGYFNGHVGRHIDVFDGVREWYGVGQRNLKGRMLLVLSGKGIMCQIHSLIYKNSFKKRDFKCFSSEKLITLNILHEVVPTWYSFHS